MSELPRTISLGDGLFPNSWLPQIDCAGGTCFSTSALMTLKFVELKNFGTCIQAAGDVELVCSYFKYVQ